MILVHFFAVFYKTAACPEQLRRPGFTQPGKREATTSGNLLMFFFFECFVQAYSVKIGRGVAGLKHVSRVTVLPILEQPKPLLILTLSLNIILVQYLSLKHCLCVVFRPKVSLRKGQGCSSIGKTMTFDLCFRPAGLGVSYKLFFYAFSLWTLVQQSLV